MLDLSKIHTDGGYKFSLDQEKVAALLEQMAAGIRAGSVVIKDVQTSTRHKNDDWVEGGFNLIFNEKE